MIPISEARAIINTTVHFFGTETVPIAEALGRVLQEPLVADRPFPPFDRVTMDGIAVRFEAINRGVLRFQVAGVVAAGTPVQTLIKSEHCLEVMTGAVMPKGADTVIRYEDINIMDGVATVLLKNVVEGKNVHRKGSDRASGSILCAAGKVIRSTEIGIAATIGQPSVTVSKRPKVMVISTGDELVDIHLQPLPHQIRKSNVFQIQAVLENADIPSDHLHLTDDLEAIKQALEVVFQDYDVVVLSGGVSKGKFDYLPQAMVDLGVKKLFYKVKQRPGKPFWFGQHPEGATIFALPGNPVSSFMCTHVYVLPWLRQSLGITHMPTAFARLTAPIHFKPDLTYFAQVKLHVDTNGTLLATPVQGNGSGDLANLTDADGFLEMPQGREVFEAGEVFRVFEF